MSRGRVLFGLVVLVVGTWSAWSGTEAVSAQASRSPFGRLDPVRVLGPGAVRITGWAVDPDTRGPIAVLVAANGRLAGGRAALARADLPRRDRRHGYAFTISGLPPGLVQVCAGALNVGPGDPGRLVGCQTVNTGGDTSPVGSIDAAVATGADTVRVSGWALDPDTAFPTPVEILVDGAVGARGVAAATRTDVAQIFPAHGPWHGYSIELRVPEGRRRLCLRPQNLAAGATRPVACTDFVTPDVNPRGAVDTVVVEGDEIVVRGSVVEADQPTPPTLTVSDRGPGPDDPALRTVVPDTPRPDGSRGFRVAWRPDRPGEHQVCVAAANRGWGSDRLLGCRTVEVTDRRPRGGITTVLAGADSVTVTGSATDPDGGPVAVRLGSDRTGATVTTGATSSFSLTLPGLTPGSHRVCVEAADVVGPLAGLDGATTWCASALVGAFGLGVADALVDEAGVGPGPGSPLTDVDRDGGVSTRLSDGSVLWLFGDSSALDAGGALRYFVSGTAAWAPAATPGTTRDALVGGRPQVAAVPTAAFPACPAAQPTPAMWPLSAVTVPDGTTDRVVAWFANMCLGSQPSFVARGTAVAEWTYDPAEPPDGRGISFTVVEQNLWAEPSYGSAAVLGADGRILAYDCEGPDQGGWYTAYGPCTVARVLPDDVADPAAYEFWDGGGWSDDPTAAAPMVMPASGPDGVGTHPPSAFTVAFDPALGRYVMAYTSWPGFTPTFWLRFATDPVGPWSEAVRVDLPDCPATIGGAERSCYAVTLQPWRSGAGRLGIGFYRMWLAADPRRGGYRSAELPVSVAP